MQFPARQLPAGYVPWTTTLREEVSILLADHGVPQMFRLGSAFNPLVAFGSLVIACPDSLPQPSPRIAIDAKTLFAKLDRN